ncbi:MAG: formate/nitrite transporter family protein [Eubacteriales bacterium]|nr:formate/nitrite transporter family protein [Eubacteriales bacterium]
MSILIASSILAGIAISLGAIVNLVVGPPLGPFLFAVGLFMVIALKLDLFTGRAGLLATKEFKPLNLLVVWVGNFIGCFVTGVIVLFTFPEATMEKVVSGATKIMTMRLNSPWYTLVVLGIMCGILMYMAVQGSARAEMSYKPFVAMLPVVVFIFSGYAHCVADMFYYSAAQMYTQAALPVLFVTIGNVIGCNIPPLLKREGSH